MLLRLTDQRERLVTRATPRVGEGEQNRARRRQQPAQAELVGTGRRQPEAGCRGARRQARSGWPGPFELFHAQHQAALGSEEFTAEPGPGQGHPPT